MIGGAIWTFWRKKTGGQLARSASFISGQKNAFAFFFFLVMKELFTLMLEMI